MLLLTQCSGHRTGGPTLASAAPQVQTRGMLRRSSKKGSLMRLMAVFEEPASMAEARHHEQAHFDYLRQHVDEILIAGGLRDIPGGGFVGGMWIFEVSSRERAVELIEGDPYFKHSQRKYRLCVWGKALPEVQAVL